MKIGDLVRYISSPHPITIASMYPSEAGIIVEMHNRDYGEITSKIYRVLWNDNLVGMAWEHDLEVISESR